ncbi:MAG: hypothetical protein QOJ25_192 [Solirubrobacteraceae bacterium]|jgi:hypothetical protein|nr:hypothetical protein [Solirubrobacteraceae bacterium]
MTFRGMPVALFAVAAIVAGCGSSSSTTTSAASNAPTPSTSAGATTHAATGFADAGNCQQLAGVGAKFGQALSAATTGGHPNLQGIASAYQGLANAAPSEIRPDVQVIAQVFTSYVGALSKVGFKVGQTPTPSQVAGIQAATQSFNQPKLRAAEQHITAWARQNCK